MNEPFSAFVTCHTQVRCAQRRQPFERPRADEWTCSAYRRWLRPETLPVTLKSHIPPDSREERDFPALHSLFALVCEWPFAEKGSFQECCRVRIYLNIIKYRGGIQWDKVWIAKINNKARNRWGYVKNAGLFIQINTHAHIEIENNLNRTFAGKPISWKQIN